MRRIWQISWLLVTIMLAGCASSTPAPSNEPLASPTLERNTATTGPAAASVAPGCTVISPEPSPGPTEQSVFPPVSPEDWSQGSEHAAITFVEYGDFQ